MIPWKLRIVALINFFFSSRSERIAQWCTNKRRHLNYAYGHARGYKFLVMAYDEKLDDLVFTYHHTYEEFERRKLFVRQSPTLTLRETSNL